MTDTFVRKLPHTPGTKEPRYTHTLGAALEIPQQPVAATLSPDRITALEGEVAQLHEEVAELRRRLDAVLG